MIEKHLIYIVWNQSNVLMYNLLVLFATFILHLQGLKLKKQRSTGDINSKGVSNIRSTGSTTSWMSSESGYPSAAGSVVSQGSDQSFAAEV